MYTIFVSIFRCSLSFPGLASLLSPAALGTAVHWVTGASGTDRKDHVCNPPQMSQFLYSKSVCNSASDKKNWWQRIKVTLEQTVDNKSTLRWKCSQTWSSLRLLKTSWGDYCPQSSSVQWGTRINCVNELWKIYFQFLGKNGVAKEDWTKIFPRHIPTYS